MRGFSLYNLTCGACVITRSVLKFIQDFIGIMSHSVESNHFK